jgi:hypothetical protein
MEVLTQLNMDMSLNEVELNVLFGGAYTVKHGYVLG